MTRMASPAALIRWAFLAHFKIKGRARKWRRRRSREGQRNEGDQRQKQQKQQLTKWTIFCRRTPPVFSEKLYRGFLVKTRMWRLVRHDLKKRFYHQTSVQPLTDAHKAQRSKFCQWILEQPSELVERIVWTDEKFFCLHGNFIEETMEYGPMRTHAKFANRMMWRLWFS